MILAERGRRVVDPGTGDQSFVLYVGRRYEGVPGEGEFLGSSSTSSVLPIRPDEEDEFVEVAAAKTTLDLFRSAALADRAELHWRVSFPLSLFVLALLAVPLSRTSPREGRYARLGMALFIYLIYTNLLSIVRVWVERGIVDDDVGMWWVHAIVALLGLCGCCRATADGSSARPTFVRSRHDAAARVSRDGRVPRRGDGVGRARRRDVRDRASWANSTTSVPATTVCKRR